MTDADTLAGANIAYRRPAVYDELTSGDGQVDTVGRIVKDLGSDIRSVLDLGCGTGRDIAAFHSTYGWAGIGVDLQPRLVDYGRSVRPGLDLRVADLRTVRLGRTFDLITCLGNSLAYIHTDDDLTAAAATFAAHAHPGTILIINTLTAPPTDHGQSTATRVDTRSFTATVTLRTHWDAATRIHTTWRHWTLDDGTTIADHLTRRVTTPGELDQLLHAAGFTSVKVGETFTAQYRPADKRSALLLDDLAP